MSDPADGGAPPAVGGAPSKLEELRAAFQKRVDEPRLFKRFPAPEDGPFADRLVAEYRVLSSKESAEALAESDEFGQMADTLIRALVAIHIHDDQHPDRNERGLVALDQWLELDTGALKFDNRLVETLDLQLDDNKARTIAKAMFNGNEIALGAQASQVLAWMTNTKTVAFQDFPTGS